LARIIIDIIGYVKGSLGIGEQVRSLIKIALLAGFDVNIFDLSSLNMSSNFNNSVDDYDHLITNTFKGEIRIYSAPLDNIAACFFTSHKCSLLDFNRNIFHIAWEFQKLHPLLNNFLNSCDEIWTISNFISSGLLADPLVPNLPIKAFPNSLNLPLAIKKNTKRDFNLPEKFIFYSTFDANSFYTRKNPFGVIEAFTKSFKNDDKCLLLIRVSNMDSSAHESLRINLHNKVAACNNIIIMNQWLSRDMSLSLLNTCDAFVSLHRSEGFGLNILEAMALSKPVIVTGYSGNMDFCSDVNSYLVDYKLRPVLESEYHYANGLQWAEPNIDSAAKMIEKVFYDEADVSRKIIKARNFIEENFLPQALVPKFKNYIESFLKGNND